MTSFAFTFGDTVSDWLTRFVSKPDLLNLTIKQYFGLCKIIKLCVLNYVQNNELYYFLKPNMLFNVRYYDKNTWVTLSINNNYQSFIEIGGQTKEITHKSLPDATMEQWLMLHLGVDYIPDTCLCCCDHIFSVIIAQHESQKPFYHYGNNFAVVYQEHLYLITKKLVVYIREVNHEETDEDQIVKFIVASGL
jgi:hypothetical protein